MAFVAFIYIAKKMNDAEKEYEEKRNNDKDFF
jgi:hypothetical protein